MGEPVSCLKLELADELPSLHFHSPVPLNTLSPRNRQQAIIRDALLDEYLLLR
jgi:hypothetical protein